jgi:nitrogen-specific signal transduction histidine kinase/HAMP domain-containing protein
MSSVLRRLRRSVPAKVFAGFAVVLVACGGFAYSSLRLHQRATATLRLLHEGFVPLALAVSEAHATQTVFLSVFDKLPYEQNAEPTRSWLYAARRARPVVVRRTLALLSNISRFGPTATEEQLLAELRAELTRVQNNFVSVEAQYEAALQRDPLASQLGPDAAWASLRETETSSEQILRRTWSRIQDYISAASAGAVRQEQRSFRELVGVGLLTLVIGFMAALWTQRVLRPLPLLRDRLQSVARGELEPRLLPVRDDDLGALIVEFERMVDALRQRDVKLRHAAETYRSMQRLQEHILNNLNAAVMVVDSERKIHSVNPSAKVVLGLGPDSIGRSLQDTSLGADVPGLLASCDEVQTHHTARTLSSVAIQREHTRYVDIRVTPFEADFSFASMVGVTGPANANAAPLKERGFLLVAHDVTEALSTKSKLIHTERLATIGRMAAHITHEVRNPLSSIGLNVDILEEELTAEQHEARQLIGSIRREIERLAQITEEYLRVVRLPAPNVEWEDLGEIARSVAQFVTPELRASRVALELRIQPSLPLVPVDEPQIRQAMLNLLRNAREAMPDGGARGA